MKIRGTINNLIVVIILTGIIQQTDAVCREYNGNVCSRLGSRNFDIPASMTDDDIDLEINNLISDATNKYSECMAFYRRAVCRIKYGECHHKNYDPSKPLIPLKACRDVCEWATKDSICYHGLNPDSKLKKWLNRLNCNKYPKSFCGDGKFLERDNERIKFNSCIKKYDPKNRKDPISVGLTPNPIVDKTVMEKTLQKYFPTEMLDDIKCNIITKRRSVNSLYDLTKFKCLPNFKHESLNEKVKPSLYCISYKGHTKITILSTKEPLYTPDRYLSLENVNYGMITDTKTEESNLVAFGDTSACDNDFFKYNIRTEKTGSTVLKATSLAEDTKWKYIEKFFGFLMVYTGLSRDVLFRKFNVAGLLTLQNMKWTTTWDNGGDRFDILTSDQGKTQMRLPPFGGSFGEVNPEDRNVTIESPEILLGSRKKLFSMYFCLQEFSIVDFLRTQLSPNFGTLADLMEKRGVFEYLKLEMADYFFTTRGDFSNILPTKEAFKLEKDSMILKVREKHDGNYLGICTGKVKVDMKSKKRPSWLDNIKLDLISKVRADAPKNQEFEIKFNLDQENPDCEKETGKWKFLNETINFFKEKARCNCMSNYTLAERKVMKNSSKDNPCKVKEDRLVSIKIYKFKDGGRLSFNVTTRNHDYEKIHIFTDIDSSTILYFFDKDNSQAKGEGDDKISSGIDSGASGEPSSGDHDGDGDDSNSGDGCDDKCPTGSETV